MSEGSLAESDVLSRVDLQIIRALQVDPRVTVAALAGVLGVSEPTVARRYGRLRRRGVLHVTGVVDPGVLGQRQYLARLRCRPGSATAIAEALAGRRDVSWVALTAAGAEVTCTIRSRSPQERDDLLDRKLPRAAAVLDVEASLIFREFAGGRGHYWEALDGALTAEQETALGSTGNPFSGTPSARLRAPELDAHDDALLDALAADGRASLTDLAAAADLTPGRVSRRLQVLLDLRVVNIHVELAAAALGYHARALLWLRVHPAATTAVARDLARMPEVGYVAAVSGRANVHALVQCRDFDELFDVVTDRIAALPGVESAETTPIHRQVKQGGTPVVDDMLHART